MDLLRATRPARRVGPFAAALFSLAFAAAPSAGLAQATEHQVKAAFLYNFTRFVEWPGGAFPAPGAPFVLCILGDEAFGAEVAETVAGKAIEGRPARARPVSELSELADCHVLFVSQTERGRLPEILAALRQLPVLTVGDADGFVGAGGMIELVLRESRVRFEIDQTAAERVGLAISSKLLDLAERVVTHGRTRGRG
jgi:hypothetical protein